MNAKLQRKFTTIVGESNTAFIMITHLSTQIGSMSYDPLIITGGKAIAYWSSMTLDLRKKSVLDSDPVSKDNHMKVGVTIKKNHCSVSRNPYVKCEYFVEYGKGILVDIEIVENAIEQDILAKSGAFIREPDEAGNAKILPDGTKLQWQGMAKFKDYLDIHPEYMEYLKNKIEGKTTAMTEEEIKDAKAEEDAIKNAVEKDDSNTKKENKKNNKKELKKEDLKDDKLEEFMEQQK